MSEEEDEMINQESIDMSIRLLMKGSKMAFWYHSKNDMDDNYYCGNIKMEQSQ